jgi:hypothetical protein
VVRKMLGSNGVSVLFGKRTTSIKIIENPTWITLSLKTCLFNEGSKRLKESDAVHLRFLRPESVNELISQLEEVRAILLERESNGEA